MDLTHSPLFDTVVHPESGVTGHVLRLDDLWYQSFYFTNPSLSLDGRYLWFYCMPDAKTRKSLGVADLEAGAIRVLPESQFGDASPMVDPADGSVYWIGGPERKELCHCGPEPDAKTTVLNRFPEEWIGNHRFRKVATHLTFTADRTAVNFDAHLGDLWMAGLMPLDGSTPEIWQRFDVCYNHAQCHPTRNDLMLIAQDFWNDVVTQERQVYTHRLWLLAQDGTHRSIYKEPTPRHGHEWWSRAGDAVWYVNYDKGVCRYDLASQETECFWGKHILHAHCTADESLLVGDSFRRHGDTQLVDVLAYNRATGAETAIATNMLLPSRRGHLHAHPQITACGTYVVYTYYTDDGRTSVALVPVAQLDVDS